jgi:uncharacterized protein
LKLCGILSDISSDTQKPIVILCHGFATGKDSSTNLVLEGSLNENDIATLRFDFFGHGESEGSFENITLSKGVDDIISAYGYLKSLGYAKIALVGSSFGGAAAILAAAQLPNLFALALKCPVSGYGELEIQDRGEDGIKEWREKGFVDYVNGQGKVFKLNYGFFEDLAHNVGYEVAKKISMSTLIVHGDEDADVPISQSIKISTMIPDCRLEIFHGADHRFSRSEDFEHMIRTIRDFIIEKTG